LVIMGTVEYYNESDGVGFIRPDNGGADVFINAMAVARAGLRGLAVGQPVSYQTAEDRRSGTLAVSEIETI
jgi:cold shock protein